MMTEAISERVSRYILDGSDDDLVHSPLPHFPIKATQSQDSAAATALASDNARQATDVGTLITAIQQEYGPVS